MKQIVPIMVVVIILAVTILLLYSGGFLASIIQCEMTDSNSCSLQATTGQQLIGDQIFVTDDSNIPPIIFDESIDLLSSSCTVSGNWQVSSWGDCSGSGSFSFNGKTEWISSPFAGGQQLLACHTNANPQITLNCADGPFTDVMSRFASGADVFIPQINVDFNLIGGGTPSPNIIPYQNPDIAVSGNQIVVTVYLENTGGDMLQDWLIELQPRQQFLSFINSPSCESSTPENVHELYRLKSGERISLQLTSTVSDGTYNLYLLGTDSCCAVSICKPVGPYGFGTFISTVSIAAIDEPTQPPSPNIVSYQNPDVAVSGNQIIVTAYLENTGGDMLQNWLIELQPRQQFLSFIGSQGNCDASTPQNVHRFYRLNSGERTIIQLTSTVDKGTYDIYLLNYDSCCPGNTLCQQTGPYSGGIYIATATVTDEPEQPTSPNVVPYRNSDVAVSGSQIKVTVYLENTGGDMTQNWLIELQPRKQFLAFLGSQGTCDSNTPQNVHRFYRLNSGERITIELTSVVDDGTHNIYLLGTDSCCTTSICKPVGPYGFGTFISTVSTDTSGDGIDPGQAKPNIVQYSSPSIRVEGNKIRTTIFLENNGGSMLRDWLIELQPRKGTLSFVGLQGTCDVNNPQNVHRFYRLSSGERISIELVSTVDDGTYNIYLVSTDSCCTVNPACQAEGAYGWGVYIGQATVGEETFNIMQWIIDNWFIIAGILLFILFIIFILRR